MTSFVDAIKMDFNKWKIFIINLPKSIERRKRMEEQLRRLNIINYEFINGVEGVEDDIEKYRLESSFGAGRKHLIKEYRHHFSPNEVGCAKSHIKAIDKAIEYNLDYVIIFEDDIILCEDFNERLNKLFRLVPKNWNHIFLSGAPSEDGTFRSLNLAPFLHVEKSIITMGAYSYILKNEIFELVKEKLSKFTKPLDNIIGDLVDKKVINSYTFYPFLTYHDSDIKSDIWGKEYDVNDESKRYFVKKI